MIQRNGQAPGRVCISQRCRTRSMTSNSALRASQRRLGGAATGRKWEWRCVCVCERDGGREGGGRREREKPPCWQMSAARMMSLETVGGEGRKTTQSWANPVCCPEGNGRQPRQEHLPAGCAHPMCPPPPAPRPGADLWGLGQWAGGQGQLPCCAATLPAAA